MKKELILTKDGSHSLFIEELNETYHSIHGSIAESMHVFIKNGLHYHPKQNVNILEIGFGTGLNTLLTLTHSKKKKIQYTTLEPYPISEKIYNNLNYSKLINSDENTFLTLHNSDWGKNVKITKKFTLYKSKRRIQDLYSEKKYDIIYFDAFAPEKQEEMWKKELFEKCYKILNEGGYLVTYCAKGIVKRTLKSVGFKVERLEGPPGKREMIRANKTTCQK